MEKTSLPVVRALILLASLAVSGTGCLKRSSPDPPHLISITPNVLDFGKVRPTESPVKLTFDICNHGRESVVIADISSGCGCTIVDIPKEPIPIFFPIRTQHNARL